MNGTVIFGLALIAVGLFVGGPGLIPMLVGGVAVIAYGAFAPSRPRPARQQRLPAESDPWV